MRAARCVHCPKPEPCWTVSALNVPETDQAQSLRLAGEVKAGVLVEIRKERQLPQRLGPEKSIRPGPANLTRGGLLSWAQRREPAREDCVFVGHEQEPAAFLMAQPYFRSGPDGALVSFQDHGLCQGVLTAEPLDIPKPQHREAEPIVVFCPR